MRMWDENWDDLPDEPRIARAERTGFPSGEAVRQFIAQDDGCDKCPVCGERCWTVYLNGYKEAVGCENCLIPTDTCEYWRKEEE